MEWSLHNCYHCKHYIPNFSALKCCEAYPGGIPGEIITGQVGHKKVFRQKNKIVFEERV